MPAFTRASVPGPICTPPARRTFPTAPYCTADGARGFLPPRRTLCAGGARPLCAPYAARLFPRRRAGSAESHRAAQRPVGGALRRRANPCGSRTGHKSACSAVIERTAGYIGAYDSTVIYRADTLTGPFRPCPRPPAAQPAVRPTELPCGVRPASRYSATRASASGRLSATSRSSSERSHSRCSISTE